MLCRVHFKIYHTQLLNLNVFLYMETNFFQIPYVFHIKLSFTIHNNQIISLLSN